MPLIRYFHPPDEEQLAAPPPPVAFEEDGDWWVGTFAVGAALAAAAAATFSPPTWPAIAGNPPFTDPEELPAGALSGQPDEDYWQNSVQPVAASFYQTLPYLPDPEEIPAGSLTAPPTFVPDEDFWAAASQSPVPYWQPPYRPEPEELPAGFLFGQPDEDYWQNSVQPVAASFYQPLPYLPDSGEIPVVAPPTFISEEDYWQNQAAPSVAALYQRLPLGDLEELPASIPSGAIVAIFIFDD